METEEPFVIPAWLRRNLGPAETEAAAEDAGYDAGFHGPNISNCRFGLFATKELTAAWERGNAKGKTAREHHIAAIAAAK